ncbi:MAG TPA: hypothetical protein VKC56_05675 [Gallionellaceae bacterium]|nr:hypothetical protein [Gallionellaceae bacterium]
MSNDKTAYHRALSTLDSLSSQQATAKAKQHEHAERRKTLGEMRSKLELKLNEVRMQNVRGLASGSAVNLAKDEVAAIAVDLFDLDAKERAVRDALSSLETEIQKQKGVVADCLNACCMADAEGKEASLRDDKKIRRVLADIYAAYVAATDPRLGAPLGARISWDEILLGMFPEPEGGEFQDTYNVYVERLQDAR